MAENTAVKHDEVIQPNLYVTEIKNGKEFTAVLNTQIISLEKVLKTTKEISNASKGGSQSDIKAVNKAYNQSAEAVNKITEARKKQAEQEKELQRLTKENIKAKEKEAARIKATSDEVVKEKLKRAAANKEQKERLKELLILEERQLGTEERILRANKKLRDERRKLNTETKTGSLRLAEINKEIDKNNAVIEKNADKLKQQKIGVGRYTDGVKSAISQSGIFSTQLATLDKIYKLLSFNIISSTASTEAQTVAVKRQSKARRLLNLTIKGTSKGLNLLAKGSIGVAIVALTSLAQFFTRTQKGVEALSSAMAGLGAAFGVLLDRFTDVGGILFDLFSGTISLSEATDKLAVSFNGVSKEIEEEIALAIDLDKKLKALEKTENSFIIVRARRLQRAKELRLESKEENKTLSERIRLLKDARNELEINSIEEEELAVKRFQQVLQIKDLEDARRRLNELTEEGIDINLSEVGFGTSLESDRKEALEVAKQIIDIRSSSADQQRTIQSEILGLQKKDAKEKEAILEANNKRILELESNRILKQLALEQARYDKELKAAKEHNEDLQLVEQVHQKKLEQIRLDGLVQSNYKLGIEVDDNSQAEAAARIKKQGETATQEKENTDKIIAQKQAENDARLELATAVIGKLSELENNLDKKRLESINNEISKFSEQRTLLQQQASEGNQDALNSLQDLDKRQAELEAQREREIEKKKRSELLLIALKLLSANLNNASNGNEAITQTTAQIGQAKTLVESLSFESGTDDTTQYSKGAGIDGKGGFNAVLHPHEKVMNATDTAKTGGLSNYAIGEIVQKYNSGQLTDVNKSFESVSISDNSELVQEMKNNTKAVTKAIANKSTYFDDNSKAIIERSRYSNNFVNTHNKVKTL